MFTYSQTVVPSVTSHHPQPLRAAFFMALDLTRVPFLIDPCRGNRQFFLRTSLHGDYVELMRVHVRVVRDVRVRSCARDFLQCRGEIRFRVLLAPAAAASSLKTVSDVFKKKCKSGKVKTMKAGGTL